MNMAVRNPTIDYTGGFFDGVSRNKLWENAIRTNDNVTYIKQTQLQQLFNYAARQGEADGYMSSPSYLLMTGRKGLWVYQRGESMVSFCWHPNIEGQVLIFPPVGPNGIELMANIINMELQPTKGFRIARIPQQQSIALSQQLHEKCPGLCFLPCTEDVLDWAYPVHTFDVKSLAEPSAAMDDYRKNINRAKKHDLVIEKLDPVRHKSEIEVLTYLWVKAHPNFLMRHRDTLAEPSRFAFELMQNKELKVDGLMVFTHDGEALGFNLWEMPLDGKRVANGITNIANTNYKLETDSPDAKSSNLKGVSELMFNEQAKKLAAQGVEQLCLGGSETRSLDNFKLKMKPIRSTPLRSIEVIRPHPRFVS